mmetsp:Transcript_83482/g.260705  ORF Transcript_83482/g.260705 Transcript_83482/m.260705 type:complete len:233 (+) Transcript_83482:66-764(+)
MASGQLFNQRRWVEVFGSSSNRCLKHRLAFSGFRLVLVLLITTIVGLDIHRDAQARVLDCYLGFLTRWVLVLQALYFWLAFWTAWRADLMVSGAVPKAERMPLYAKATWVMQDTSLPGAVLVCFLFWVLVVPFQETPPDVGSYLVHGVNVVMSILDMVVSRQPYYLRHAAYYLNGLALYVIFTLIDYAAGGTDCRGHRSLYKVVSWSHPWRTELLTGVCVVVAPLLNLLFGS